MRHATYKGWESRGYGNKDFMYILMTRNACEAWKRFVQGQNCTGRSSKPKVKNVKEISRGFTLVDIRRILAGGGASRDGILCFFWELEVAAPLWHPEFTPPSPQLHLSCRCNGLAYRVSLSNPVSIKSDVVGSGKTLGPRFAIFISLKGMRDFHQQFVVLL